MIDLLEKEQCDVALTVTDGFLASRARGRQVELIGTYVESPLTWAVAVDGKHPSLHSLADLKAAQHVRFGISRQWSGSHTMAQYLATSLGVSGGVDTVVAHNFAGLCAGVKAARSTEAADAGAAADAEGRRFEAFLWETFTTKPWVDSGELRKIGDVETPWTAFSLVARAGRAAQPDFARAVRGGLLPALADGVRHFVREAAEEGEGSSASARRIAREHGHRPEDAQAWLRAVRYAVSSSSEGPLFAVDAARTERSVAILRSVGLIQSDVDVRRDVCGGDNAIVDIL